MLKTRNEWGILPYETGRIKDRYLVTSSLGSWALLEKGEFKKLHRYQIKDTEPLFGKLKDAGIIVDRTNSNNVIEDFRRLNNNWFLDVGLHIAVVTNRCNLGCLYCQTRSEQKGDMDVRVAAKILEYLFATRTPTVNLEFQGGEPLLNWEAVEYLVHWARKSNTTGKNLKIGLVSNLSLLDEKKIDFLIENDVDLCTSLDGPSNIHNQHRRFKDGKGSYDVVVGMLEKLKNRYKKGGINKSIGVLPTITKQSLPYFKEIIDEYVKHGIESIALRPVNRVGLAEGVWEEIGYEANEFNRFWKNSLDYILRLNKKGINIQERVATVILKKIFLKQDPMYVDLASPCGAGRTVLTYAPNGDVYTCDEARMIGSDLFKLGNVLEGTYSDIMKNPNIFYACQASLMQLWDYNSPFAIWSGTCPVLNFYEQGSTVVKIGQTPRQKIYKFQFNYIFEKMIEDQDALEIFKNWTKRGVR